MAVSRSSSTSASSRVRASTADRQVVPDHQRPVGVDAGHQLVELQRQQPAVGAEFDDVPGDLVGDAADHLQALDHRDGVADGHQILDLQGGEGAGDLVQAELVPLEGGQGLVGAGQDRRGVVQDVPLTVDVEADDPHRLADRDDRVAGLPGDPLGGAVPGAGLLRRDRRVGHQVHGGAHDAGAVAGEDDGAVHLAQLPDPGRGELHVQREAAGAELLHDAVVAEHDERARTPAQDAFETVAQGGPGGHEGEIRAQRVAGQRRATTGVPTDRATR